MHSAWDTAAIWLLDAAVKSVLIFAAAMLLCMALRKHSASSRHSIWLAAMVAMFCLPLLRATLPALRLHVLPSIAVPAHAQSDPAVAPRVMTSTVVLARNIVPAATRNLAHSGKLTVATPVKYDGVETVVSHRFAVPPLKRAVSSIRLQTLAHALILIWIAGVIFLAMRLAAGLIGASRLVRSCDPLPHMASVEEGKRLLAISSEVQARIGRFGSRPRVPMTCWGRGPIILLPQTVTEWPEERMQSVILHEMAHVKRLDWFTMLLAQAVCAVYWLNPLAWIAGRLLRLEAEKASDELVLRSGVSPSDYAGHLLAIARALVPSDRPVAAMAMARETEIAQRLSAILAFRAVHAGKRIGRVLGLAVLIAAGLLAAVQLSPRGRAVRAAAMGAVSGVLHAQFVNTFVTGDEMNSVAFTPDSARLLTGSWNVASRHGAKSEARMAFLSVASGKTLLSRQLSTALVAASYSPNGRLLATLYVGGYLHISDGDTGLTLRSVQLPSAALDTLEFSPDGLTVACAAVGDGKSRDTAGRLYLVDTATAKVRGPEYRGIFRQLQQHWDGRPFTVAPQLWRVVQWNPRVTLWAPQWGKPTIGLDVHADSCASHGRLLAVLNGGSVQLWDTVARRSLTSFSTGMGTGRNGSRIVFSPDGHSLAIGANGEIKVWRIDGIENIALAAA